MGCRTSAHCLRFANPTEAPTNSANMAPIAAKLRQNAFQTICNFRFFDAGIFFSKKNSDFFFGFLLFSLDFGGSGEFWTSKSRSWRHFAADGRVLRPVRGLEAVAGSSGPRTAPRPGPSYARFLVFLEAWILSVWEVRRIAGLWSALHALRPEASADFCDGAKISKTALGRCD